MKRTSLSISPLPSRGRRPFVAKVRFWSYYLVMLASVPTMALAQETRLQSAPSLWLPSSGQLPLNAAQELPSATKPRFIVDVLKNGVLRFPSRTTILSSIPTPEVEKQLSQNATGDLYAALDCLQWTSTRAPAPDPFIKYPELAERALNGRFGNANQGKFASPFHPLVQKELEQVVTEIATKYPSVNGLVLRCELPWGRPLLGYSEISRADSMQALGIDPANVLLGSSDSKQQEEAETWMAWRNLQVSQLVERLARTFKQARPGRKVLVIGYAGWSKMKPGKQNTTLANWPMWLKSKNVDGVILEDQWRSSGLDTFELASSKVEKAGKTMSFLVSPDQVRTPADLKLTAAALSGYKISDWVFKIEDEADTQRFVELRQQVAAYRQNPALMEMGKTSQVPTKFVSQAIKVGRAAPDFIVKDMNGRVVRLSEWKNEKNVLLTFFPKCFTGGCEQHLESLRSVSNELVESQVEVLAVSTDPAETQRRFADYLGLNFTLIPDTSRNVSSLYGAVKKPGENAQRQTILIDKTGVVRLIDTDIQVQTHGADMLAKIRELGLNGPR